MTDFRIVQLKIDDEYYYVRRETVGASTIDGENGYRNAFVIAHFKQKFEIKTKPESKVKPTKMDRLGAKARTICVTVLHTLSNCDVEKADEIKAEEVGKLKRKHPGKVVNVR